MSPDHEEVETIAVVGGGDGGLLTALALDRGTRAQVVVVDDFQESVPEVGKSTLYNVVPFLTQSLGINEWELMRNVKFAWKTTVYIKDWCGVDSFHSPLGLSLPTVDGTRGVAEWHNSLTSENEAWFHEFYYRYKQGEFTTTYGEVAETPGIAPIHFGADIRSVEKALPNASFHFNSRSLNRYLRELCQERGVQLIDDRVCDLETTGDWIDAIQSDTKRYEADLYVDASGFKRVLMGELDNDFVEFDLPVDSAVVSTVDIPLSEIVSATVVTTCDAGWVWQIDTMDGDDGDRDLGYVYSSDHISDEAAKREFIETRDENIDPDEVRWYEFESGVLERPWIGNCVAIGNALGFVEPLQSTALSTTCMLANRLTKLLGKHQRLNHQGIRDVFNESTRRTWEEVYDFISLYYKYNQGETEFWEDARSINPGTVPQYDRYQEAGISAWWEISELNRRGGTLNEDNVYYHVLAGLGVESEFYENLDVEVDPQVAEAVDEYTEGLSDEVGNYLSYKEFHHAFDQ